MVEKINILVYVHENKICGRLHKIFNHDFQLKVTQTKEEFLYQASNSNMDVGIQCYCYADEKDVNSLLKLREKANHIPHIVCTKIPNPDFITLGAQKGLDSFLLCNMPQVKIRARILNSIKENGLKVFIESHVKSEVNSPYTRKIITKILHTQPLQLHVTDLASSLGITSRWLQSLFRDIFGMTYTELMRRIHVFQALNLMKNTRLDNTEIALKLTYSDENSLYRIFQKELGFSPTKAREYLINKTPTELLN